MDKTEKLIDWKEDERKDRNRDGIDDDLEPPIPDVSAGSRQLAQKLRNEFGTDQAITAGEVDADFANAEFSGEETALGDTPTPDQGAVDEIGRSIGIEYAADEVLKVGEKEESRDQHRWELDPASSEDYVERVRDEGGLDRDKKDRQ
jgi:hypothetical protein